MDGKFERNRFDADLVARALKDASFRRKLLEDPRSVYAAELQKVIPGQTIPDGVEIRVAQEAENVFYVVLPCVPPSLALSDAALEKLARHETTHREPCWGLGDAPE